MYSFRVKCLAVEPTSYGTSTAKLVRLATEYDLTKDEDQDLQSITPLADLQVVVEDRGIIAQFIAGNIYRVTMEQGE